MCRAQLIYLSTPYRFIILQTKKRGASLCLFYSYEALVNP